MLTQSNPGAVGFPLQQATLRIHYLATEKLILGNCFVIRFVFDCLVVHHDTLRYPVMYRLMSFKDCTIQKRCAVRLFENFIFTEISIFVFEKFEIDFEPLLELLDVCQISSDAETSSARILEILQNDDFFANASTCHFRDLIFFEKFTFSYEINLQALPPVTRLTVHWRPYVSDAWRPEK